MTKDEIVKALGYTYVSSLDALNEWLQRDFSDEYATAYSHLRYRAFQFPMYMMPVGAYHIDDGHNEAVMFATISVETMNKVCGELS